MLIGCEQATGPDKVLPRLELTAQQLQLAESADRFGLKLFREIVRQEPDKNIFISPLSVSMALGMTANGAAGTTLDSMRATLELTGLTEEESNAAYQSLMALLTQADPQVQFDVANSIWYRQEWTFEENFYQRCRDYFDAVVQGLDFNNPAAADTINQWVIDNTQGKITEIVKKPIDIDIVMFLINAIYFKGTWTYEFDPQDTKDDQFTLADGTRASCRMMEQEADLPYMANDLFQAVDLPYGDGLFSMTVLLPRPGVYVDSVTAELTAENWPAWIGELDTAAVLLQFPKFTMEYELEMTEVLSALGMKIAFGKGLVDFSRMIEPPGLIWIGQVKHKTFVKVNEEGTEAAAATSVEMVFESAGPSSISMRIDRPFIFVIRERTSGAMLFMGKIVEPLWEE
ncbi:MAG: serpin family protein [Candidatus Marinimicrobia bacterium]|nr:serpin family protein [Candidatus Neomarinimicrobiota bacterium]